MNSHLRGSYWRDTTSSTAQGILDVPVVMIHKPLCNKSQNGHATQTMDLMHHTARNEWWDAFETKKIVTAIFNDSYNSGSCRKATNDYLIQIEYNGKKFSSTKYTTNVMYTARFPMTQLRFRVFHPLPSQTA